MSAQMKKSWGWSMPGRIVLTLTTGEQRTPGEDEGTGEVWNSW